MFKKKIINYSGAAIKPKSFAYRYAIGKITLSPKKEYKNVNLWQNKISHSHHSNKCSKIYFHGFKPIILLIVSILFHNDQCLFVLDFR